MRTLTFSMLLTLLAFHSEGQYALAGFSLEDSVEHWFDQQIGLQAHELFIGGYESLEGRPAIEEATWGNSIWLVGNLSYRGAQYQEVYLLYDLEKDALLTKNHLNSAILDQPIRLNQEQVDWFVIDGERFVQRSFPEINAPQGFYHELHAVGSFGFYAKRKKVRDLDVNQINLLSDDSFYLLVKGKTYRVIKPSSFYRLFPTLKVQLKLVFKSLSIRKFEDASIRQLKQMARRCEPILSQHE
ncbi:MAG: hypothetical protein R8G66_17255 [Cytophagales bacterium]|nr:hypothetical protein [Cytophagales bacterium]